MAERNSTPCFIKQLAAEAGIVCDKDCPVSIDASECRPLKSKSVIPDIPQFPLEKHEYVSTFLPDILTQIQNASLTNRKTIEIEDGL